MFSKTLAMFVFLSMPPYALATQGAGSGGGGHQVNTSDESVLADRYSDNLDENERLDANTYQMHPKTAKELYKALDIFERYLGSRTLADSILNPHVMYLKVDEIPDREICKKSLKFTNLPPDSELAQFACTDGNRTFIVPDRLEKLSHRDQALGYIHEGLRRLNAPDYILTAVTNGLKTALDHYEIQSQGDFTHQLDQEELDKLFNLTRSALLIDRKYDGTNLEFRRIRESLRFTPFGGLIHKKNKDFFKATLGIGANFFKNDAANIKLDESAKILNSEICVNASSCVVGKNVEIDSVSIKDPKYSGTVIIGENAKLKSAFISDFKQLNIESNAQLINLSLKGASINSTRFQIGPDVKLTRFYVKGCFNCSTLKFPVSLDGEGASGEIVPSWPLTFTTINSVSELRKKMFLDK